MVARLLESGRLAVSWSIQVGAYYADGDSLTVHIPDTATPVHWTRLEVSDYTLLLTPDVAQVVSIKDLAVIVAQTGITDWMCLRPIVQRILEVANTAAAKATRETEQRMKGELGTAKFYLNRVLVSRLPEDMRRALVQLGGRVVPSDDRSKGKSAPEKAAMRDGILALFSDEEVEAIKGVLKGKLNSR